MTLSDRQSKSRRDALRARVLYTLKLMAQTGERITFSGNVALLWVERVPIEVLNELLACQALKPIGKDNLALGLSSTGRQMIHGYRLASLIKQAIKSGEAFRVESGKVVWQAVHVKIKLNHNLPNPIDV